MRVQVVVAVLLLFVSGSAFALIGPPTADLTKGQWSGGLNYSYSSQDIGKKTMKFQETDFDSGGNVTDTFSGSFKLEIKDFAINRYYGQVGYGLLDSWEVYGQAGMQNASAKSREIGETDWFKYNSDNDFAWGLGTKYTFYKQQKIDWGATAQINWFTIDYTKKFTETFDIGGGATETDNWKDNTNVDAIDLTIAVGPTINMGKWKLYGGALYQLLTADYGFKETGVWETTTAESGSWIEKESGDYDQNSFGGYIGAQFDVYKNWNVKAEGLATDNGWGVAAGIDIPF